MNKSIIIPTLASLLIGICVGYLIGGTGANASNQILMSASNTGEHSKPYTHKMAAGEAMEGRMTDMVSGLEGKTGAAFDKEFLTEMITHHEGAVTMAEAVLKTSKRPELLKLAKDIISAQTGEITMMKNWQKEWFGR